MSYNAGEVTVTLRGDFDPAAFSRYQAAVDGAAARTKSAEAQMTAAHRRQSVALGKVGSVAKTGAAAGLFAVAAATVNAVRVSANFNAELAKTNALGGEYSKRLGEMKKLSIDLGTATGVGATQAAKGITALAKGGLSATQILKGGLAGAISLAQAGEMDLGAAAETTANALNLFGLSGDKATHIADALSTAANATTADVSDFAIALTQGGGAAKAAGLSLDETVTALEALALAGVKGSDAGTSLKTALSQIAKPTKESAETMKKLGLDFFDAQGKMKPLPAIADNLRDGLGKLTNQQRLAALQTIAGTDGFRALLALYDQGPDAIEKLSNGLKNQGTAAKTAKDNNDTLGGSLKKAKAEIEAVNIALGDPLQGPLKGAVDGFTKFVDQMRTGKGAGGDFLVEAGQQLKSLQAALTPVLSALEDGGTEVASALRDAGPEIEKVVNTIADLTGIAAPVIFDIIASQIEGATGVISGGVHAIDGLITAVDGIVHLNPGQALQGLEDVASGLGNAFASAADAITPDAFTGPIKAAVDTILGLVSTVYDAIGGLYGALAPLDPTGLFAGAEAGAHKAADSINKLRDSLNGVDKTKPHVKIDVGNLHLAQAALAKLDQTKLGPKVMGIVMNDDTTVKTKIRQLEALGIKPKTAKIIADAASAINGAKLAKASLDSVPSDKKTKVTATTSGKDKVDAMTGSVRAVPKGASPKVTASASGKDQVDGVSASMRAVPPSFSRTVTVTTNNVVNNITNNIVNTGKGVGGDAVNPKGKPRAAGRPAGAAERALVGEGEVAREYVVDPSTGAVTQVNGPTMMDLAPTAYVVPTDPKYRGRALGFLSDIARDLGVRGYEGGRGGKKLPVPEKFSAGAVDESAYKETADAARKSWEKRTKSIDSDTRARDRLDPKITEAQKDESELLARHDKKGKKTATAKQKREAHKKVKDLQTQRTKLAKQVKRLRDGGGKVQSLAKLTKDYEQTKANYQELHGTNLEIARLNTVQETERKKMEVASKAGNKGAYDTAKTTRDTSLETLRKKTARALAIARQANPKSALTAALDSSLQDILGAQQEEVKYDPTAGDEETEADRIADTGMTDAERGRQAELDRDISVAGLTETLDDDKAAMGAKAAFLQGIFDDIQDGSRSLGGVAYGFGASTIGQTADALKQVRDNLTALTTGSGTVDNPDLQAQLDQANERARVATENYTRAQAAVSAFGGSGDIGTGGYANAYQAASQPQIVIQTLHPGSPAVYEALASAAVRGFDLQNPVPSPRQTVGL